MPDETTTDARPESDDGSVTSIEPERLADTQHSVATEPDDGYKEDDWVLEFLEFNPTPMSTPKVAPGSVEADADDLSLMDLDIRTIPSSPSVVAVVIQDVQIPPRDGSSTSTTRADTTAAEYGSEMDLKPSTPGPIPMGDHDPFGAEQGLLTPRFEPHVVIVDQGAESEAPSSVMLTPTTGTSPPSGASVIESGHVPYLDITRTRESEHFLKDDVELQGDVELHWDVEREFMSSDRFHPSKEYQMEDKTTKGAILSMHLNQEPVLRAYLMSGSKCSHCKRGERDCTQKTTAFPDDDSRDMLHTDKGGCKRTAEDCFRENGSYVQPSRLCTVICERVRCRAGIIYVQDKDKKSCTNCVSDGVAGDCNVDDYRRYEYDGLGGTEVSDPKKEGNIGQFKKFA